MNPFFSLILSIVEFILAIGVLAFIHEFGHFITSRLFKIEVEEFGFGFPPRAVRLFNLWGTEFTLNWIPFGAFVRPKGENDPNVPGGLAAANPWKRLVVLMGGPLMNLVTGIIIFSTVFMQTGAPNYSQVQIVSVVKDSPAEIAGLQAKDIFLKVNQEEIDSMEKLLSVVKANVGSPVSITFKRGDQILTVQATPRVNPPAGEGALGIAMGNPVVQISFFQAIPYSFQVTLEQGRQLILMPYNLIKGQISPEAARVVGPKGMFDIYEQARTQDEAASSTSDESNPAVNTLILFAVISIALGFTNLLPFPALDGGRILFVLPEILIHKRIPTQYENAANAIGFALLILLMVYITAQDIINPIILK